jgi:hypothetical protein
MPVNGMIAGDGDVRVAVGACHGLTNATGLISSKRIGEP